MRWLQMHDSGATGRDGLRLARELFEWKICATNKRASLESLAALEGLDELSLENQSKDLEILAELPMLRELVQTATRFGKRRTAPPE